MKETNDINAAKRSGDSGMDSIRCDIIKNNENIRDIGCCTMKLC